MNDLNSSGTRKYAGKCEKLNNPQLIAILILSFLMTLEVNDRNECLKTSSSTIGARIRSWIKGDSTNLNGEFNPIRLLP